MKMIIEPGNYQGTISIPSSKSDGQRAVIAAGLAKGTSRIMNFGNSKDEEAALNAMITLGAIVESREGKELLLRGTRNFPPSATLHTGESGLSMRLLTSICAAHSGNYTITGEGSLSQRPMTFFDTYLPLFGATVQTSKGYITVQGPMKGTSLSIDGSQSSQYVSGLLMGLPLLPSESRLEVENLKSTPYLKMTLKTLSSFGIIVEQQAYQHFIVPGNQHYLSAEYIVEGDWSSASYWLVASALGQDIVVKGLSLSSLQADKALLDVFITSGCNIQYKEDGIQIDGTNKKAFTFDATDCPDLFPALVSYAAHCEGISVIKGVSRLWHKESNRSQVLKEEFSKLGVQIFIDQDDMHIYGRKFIEGGIVSSHNDHRIAMCLAVAGMFASSPVEIDGSEAVEKSYRNFWEDFSSLKRH